MSFMAILDGTTTTMYRLGRRVYKGQRWGNLSFARAGDSIMFCKWQSRHTVKRHIEVGIKDLLIGAGWSSLLLTVALVGSYFGS